jgi:hypothetical protein
VGPGAVDFPKSDLDAMNKGTDLSVSIFCSRKFASPRNLASDPATVVLVFQELKDGMWHAFVIVNALTGVLYLC